MQSVYTIIDTTIYHRILLHTFLVVLCHRKVILGQFHGSYYPSAPRVAIGPYRPWEGRFPPPPHAVPHAIKGRLPPNHPGYQTNIVIDQTGKAKSVVEITTEDLSTGLEVGKTEWSGPGTLTLSALATILDTPRHRKRASPAFKPRQDYEFVHSLKHHEHPIGHPKNEFELIQVPTYHQPIRTPKKILGEACNTNYDCSKALNAVCFVNTHCQSGPLSQSCHQRVCQCPPYHHQHLNDNPDHYRRPHRYHVLERSDARDEHFEEIIPFSRDVTNNESNIRRRRSLRYYEECRHDPRYR